MHSVDADAVAAQVNRATPTSVKRSAPTAAHTPFRGADDPLLRREMVVLVHRPNVGL